MTNKSSTFPRTPLECLRDEVLEAGEGDMGHAGISAACMDGYWQFLSHPEHLEWLKLVKWVMNQKIPCRCSGQREDKSCCPAQ